MVNIEQRSIGSGDPTVWQEAQNQFLKHGIEHSEDFFEKLKSSGAWKLWLDLGSFESVYFSRTDPEAKYNNFSIARNILSIASAPITPFKIPVDHISYAEDAVNVRGESYGWRESVRFSHDGSIEIKLEHTPKPLES